MMMMMVMIMEMVTIFIRSLGVVDQLEEWRRDRLEELVVLSRNEGSLKSLGLNTTNGIIWAGRGREGDPIHV